MICCEESGEPSQGKNYLITHMIKEILKSDWFNWAISYFIYGLLIGFIAVHDLPISKQTIMAIKKNQL